MKIFKQFISAIAIIIIPLVVVPNLVQAQNDNKNKEEQVDLFGFSRGGALAYAVANTLLSDPAFAGKKIRFMGVVDPRLPIKSIEDPTILHSAIGPDSFPAN